MKDWEAKAARHRAEGDEEEALYEEGFWAHAEGQPRNPQQRRAWLEGWDDAEVIPPEVERIEPSSPEHGSAGKPPAPCRAALEVMYPPGYITLNLLYRMVFTLADEVLVDAVRRGMMEAAAAPAQEGGEDDG